MFEVSGVDFIRPCGLWQVLLWMIVVCVFSYVTVCIVFDHVGKWWVYRCIMCSVLLIYVMGIFVILDVCVSFVSYFVIMSGYVLCDDLVFC